MNTLKVIAAAGLSVPMEDKPRIYITDSEAVTVADTSYYQRRLSDGDLLLQEDVAADEPAQDPAPAAASKPRSK